MHVRDTLLQLLLRQRRSHALDAEALLREQLLCTFVDVLEE